MNKYDDYMKEVNAAEKKGTVVREASSQKEYNNRGHGEKDVILSHTGYTEYRKRFPAKNKQSKNKQKNGSGLGK